MLWMPSDESCDVTAQNWMAELAATHDRILSATAHLHLSVMPSAQTNKCLNILLMLLELVYESYRAGKRVSVVRSTVQAHKQKVPLAARQ